MKLIILLLLPLIEAKISIQITMKRDDNQILLSGCSSDVISETETRTFNITDNNLKNAIQKYSGERPDHVYLKSPTPWGDLYDKYSWQEVERHLRPQRAVKKNLYVQKVHLSKQYYTNKGNSSIISIKLVEQIKNSVTSRWLDAGVLSVNDYLVYDIKIEDYPTILYMARYNQNVNKSKVVKITADIDVHLAPNQSVVAHLVANRTKDLVQIDYEAHLTGSVAVNYVKKYDGHHFWGMDINSVMAAAKLNPTVKVMEEIKVVHYTDARIVVRDDKTSDLLFSFPVVMSY